MASSSTTFQYEPLDKETTQIRLIKILPRAGADETIRCEMRTFLLDTRPRIPREYRDQGVTHPSLGDGYAPPYSCLSYVWGPPKPTQTMEFDGEPFTVRQNLFDFLKFARKEYERQPWLWVDQLCIDQSMEQERSHQVQMMGSIYYIAEAVLCWLGVSTPALERVAVAIHAEMARYENRPRPDYEKPSEQDMQAFFQIPYWSRLWIVQEIMLASHVRVLLGGLTMDLEHIYQAYINAKYWFSYEAPIPDYSKVQSLTNRGHPRRYDIRLLPPGQYLPLYRLMYEFNDSGCTDPRDKVFGLLGMVHPVQQIAVDYSKSPDTIFLVAAANIVQYIDIKSPFGNYSEGRKIEDIEFERFLSPIVPTSMLEVSYRTMKHNRIWLEYNGTRFLMQFSATATAEIDCYEDGDEELDLSLSQENLPIVTAYETYRRIPQHFPATFMKKVTDVMRLTTWSETGLLALSLAMDLAAQMTVSESLSTKCEELRTFMTDCKARLYEHWDALAICYAPFITIDADYDDAIFEGPRHEVAQEITCIAQELKAGHDIFISAFASSSLHPQLNVLAAPYRFKARDEMNLMRNMDEIRKFWWIKRRKLK